MCHADAETDTAHPGVGETGGVLAQRCDRLRVEGLSIGGLQAGKMPGIAGWRCTLPLLRQSLGFLRQFLRPLQSGDEQHFTALEIRRGVDGFR